MSKPRLKKIGYEKEVLISQEILLTDQLESEEIISNQQLKKIIQDAFIPGLSVAFISPDKKIETHALGVTSLETKPVVTFDTQFWACSLSKPVFIFLVSLWAIFVPL